MSVDASTALQTTGHHNTALVVGAWSGRQQHFRQLLLLLSLPCFSLLCVGAGNSVK
jgi:hypothetical protein